jgi:hypothetical protein
MIDCAKIIERSSEGKRVKIEYLFREVQLRMCSWNLLIPL